ncbi:tetratricopeptide repeat protein [Streptomyces yunnanensis]|uniref:NB-ARC domain-containing protein n=1 Tax=Streptomyces yunnanensis TaxID=156453 RepID=A0A9X8QSG0_9ACTN|nr:tetratricopeptide repeat protein [Streptomyces yunnanensis]SHL76962.1 NB-ARC domain-containing protein [Streptomyces yunnanensis]
MAEETWNSVAGDAQVGSLVQAGHIGAVHLHGPPSGTQRRTPCQLPLEIRHFEDRDGEQARVLRATEDWLGGGPDPARPLIISISGLTGVGKTTLGFRITRPLLESCPDGVLHADLDEGRRDGAADIADVLGQMLRALGVPQDEVERSLTARRRQYLDETRHRRLVVVLDNVRRFEGEAELLMPASAGSAVVLVGPRTPPDFDPGVAVELPLSPLTEDHAVRLLLRIAGDQTPAADPEAVAELARLCAGLPAALRVAGHWVRRHRRRGWARLLAGLTIELQRNGVPETEPVWNATYHDLGGPARTLYRLLAAEPGPAISPQAAVALLGTGEDAAEEALEELEDAGLLDLVPDLDDDRAVRLRMHALVRDHARRRAATDAADGEAAGGWQRNIRWHLRQAQRADELWAGKRMTLAARVSALPGAPDVDFQGKTAALRWLHSERRVLHACVRVAHDAGLHAESWALCEPLWTHQLDHPGSADDIDSFTLGRDAALRAGDLPAAIRMRCQLARPLWESERFVEAGRELDAAVSAAALLGSGHQDRKLFASALEFRGRLQAEQGKWSAAVPDYRHSLRLHQQIENPYGEMLLTYLLGQASAGLDELDRSAQELGIAHTMARELKRERMTARTGFALGRVLLRLGRAAEARQLYEAALDAARERRSLSEQVRVLEALGGLYREEGDEGTAERYLAAAHALRSRPTGSPPDPSRP